MFKLKKLVLNPVTKGIMVEEPAGMRGLTEDEAQRVIDTYNTLADGISYFPHEIVCKMIQD